MEKHSSMDEQFLSMVYKIIEENISNEKFSVNELAEKTSLSRSMLHRKIKKLTGKSSIELITEIRLQKARNLLENNAATASEIAYMVGFSEPGYFNKVFKKYFHITPGEVRKKGVPKKLLKKRPNTIISAFVIILLLIIFFILNPFSNQQIENEKTIAVLPFTDDSPEKGNEYITNGLMEEILYKLQIIEELNIKSRIDSEKYKDSKLSIREIARKLNVNYILTGSCQKIGNSIKLSAQLIEASSGNNLWSYINEVSDERIFELQEDVAFSIASELEAKLTTKEKVQIQEIPTDNLVAYNYFLRGLQYYNLYVSTATRSTAEESYRNRLKAQKQFEMALKLDSSFIRPYIPLAALSIQDIKYYNTPPEIYFSYLDSGMAMIELALYHANKKTNEMTWEKARIFDLKGSYYLHKGEKEIAFEYFEQHDEFMYKNPDAYKIFASKALRYDYLQDGYNTIRNALQYIRLKPVKEEVTIDLLRALYRSFKSTGYIQEAKEYAKKILIFNGDSLTYFINLYQIEEDAGNFSSAQKYLEIAHSFDEDYDWCTFLLLGNSILQKKFEIAKEYIDEIENRYDVLPYHIYSELFLGITYMKNGMPGKAEKHLETLKNKLIQQIDLKLPEAQVYWSYFNLANIYSLLNEKEKALEYLKEVLKRESIPQFMVTILKESPVYDNIREEHEFQEILSLVTKKYQNEHERVGELLREFDEIE